MENENKENFGEECCQEQQIKQEQRSEKEEKIRNES